MKRVFKINDNKSKQKGVSLITLVITMVVIILLASIAILNNLNTADQAAVAEFKTELKGVEVGVATYRANNQTKGIGEKYKEAGFYKAFIENPPKDFVSFGSGEYYGYVVDIEKLGDKEIKKGKDYTAYQYTESDPKMITFGEKGTDNDVYVYDATGKIFYAKGLYITGGVYYSDILTMDGPTITVTRLPIEDEDGSVKEVKLTIKVEPEEAGQDVILRIDNELQTSTGDTYEFIATRNGIYCVTAEEGLERSAMKNVPVTEIKEIDYVITYHYLDETNRVETQTKYANATSRLKGATRDGYILVGWSESEETLTSDYAPGSTYEKNEDIDLYAVWKEGIPKEYTISFNANGGTNAPAAIKKIQGEEILLPSEVPTRTGYSFSGWSVRSDNKQVDYLPEGSYAEDKDITLYAVWSIGQTELKIEFSPVGTGTSVGEGIKNKGEVVYITAIANPGYEFEKWTVKEGSVPVELANAYSSTTKLTMPSGTVTLVAHLKEVSYDYIIQYDANGGTAAPQPQQKRHGVNVNISTSVPRKSGQEFAGWSDTAAAKIPKYQPGDVYDQDKNVTLYAVWSQNTTKYTLTFDANGGIDAPAPITRPANSIVTIPAQIPNRSNLLFVGWNEDKNSKNATYVRSSELILDRNLTLYAIWSDTDKPVANITAKEESGELVLLGNATDNGGITHYAWTNEFYLEENISSIPWEALSNYRLDLTVKKDVIRAGLHYFYVKDADDNYAYSSIEVYKMDFKTDGTIIQTKYKASGYEATLSKIIPKKDRYVFDRWQGASDGRIYEETDTYLLNRNEVFNALWIEAVAWIPSQNEYFLSANDAGKTISASTSNYVLIELLKDDVTPFGIVSGQMISFDTKAFQLNVNGNAISVPNGAKFRFINGTVKATEYALKNQGETELLAGNLSGKYGASNSNKLTLGDVTKTYAKDSVKLTGTTSSYSKASTGATLLLQNGCLVDSSSPIPSSNLTPRTDFIYRVIDKGTQKITTITEKITISSQITVGTSAKALERNATIQSAITTRDTGSKIEYAIDTGAYTVGASISPIRDNCTIKARTVDSDGTAAETTLAITDIKELVVTLIPNGGTVSPTTINVKYKRPYNFYRNLPDATRDYYNFQGWYTAQTGGDKIVSTQTVEITNDQTLYAQWEGIQVEVTFDPNEGQMSTSQNTMNVTYDQKYGTLLQVKPRTNYTFLGWFTQRSGGTEVTANTDVTNPNTHTLYAHWKLDAYTITFDANGGTPATQTKQIVIGNYYEFPTTPTKSGNYFNGWWTEASGGTQISTNQKPDRSRTVYAHWEEGFSVWWHSYPFGTDGYYREGYIRVKQGQRYDYYESLPSLPDVTFSQEYRFSGWYLDDSNTPTTSISNSSIVQSSTSLIAKWAYKGSCENCGGTGSVQVEEKWPVSVTSPAGTITCEHDKTCSTNVYRCEGCGSAYRWVTSGCDTCPHPGSDDFANAHGRTNSFYFGGLSEVCSAYPHTYPTSCRTCDGTGRAFNQYTFRPN